MKRMKQVTTGDPGFRVFRTVSQFRTKFARSSRHMTLPAAFVASAAILGGSAVLSALVSAGDFGKSAVRARALRSLPKAAKAGCWTNPLANHSVPAGVTCQPPAAELVTELMRARAAMTNDTVRTMNNISQMYQQTMAQSMAQQRAAHQRFMCAVSGTPYVEVIKPW